MKKYLIPIIAILCIGGIILVACAVKSTPAAQPVDAPASVAEPEPVTEPESELTVEPEPQPKPESEPAVESEPQPEPEPEPEFHCDFDAAVEAFLSENQENPDIDLTIDPTPLYEYLLSEGIDPDYIQSTMCDNEYVDPFLNWYRGNTDSNIGDIEIVPGSGQPATWTEEEQAEFQQSVDDFKAQAAAEAERRREEARQHSWHGAGNF